MRLFNKKHKTKHPDKKTEKKPEEMSEKFTEGHMKTLETIRQEIPQTVS